MQLWLANELRSLIGANDRETFRNVMALNGESIRRVEKRHTFRCLIDGSMYFVKQHQGPMWKEAAMDLLRFSRPILGADNECRISFSLMEIGVPVAQPVGYGVCASLGKRQSFLITRALENTRTVNEVLSGWRRDPGTKKSLHGIVRVVARLTSRMHSAGINHRDLYINHFRLAFDEMRDERAPVLYVMDLHRAQKRSAVPARWIVKDLAALLFSCLDKPLRRRHVLLFLRHYYPETLLHEILHDTRFLCAIIDKALAIRSRAERKGAAPLRDDSLYFEIKAMREDFQ